MISEPEPSSQVACPHCDEPVSPDGRAFLLAPSADPLTDLDVFIASYEFVEPVEHVPGTLRKVR